MKKVILLALAGMMVLTACKKTEMTPTAAKSNLSSQSNLSSMNGKAGIQNIYYDGQLFMMNLYQFPASTAATLLANNKSVNILYEATGFVTVTNEIQGGGPGYNALWQEVDIVFNTGFTPHQFLSDNDILPASMGTNPEITLVPTNEVYRCDIVQHTKPQ